MFSLQRGITGRCLQYFKNTIRSKSTMPSLQHEISTPYEKATFGMGCFWASDSLYGATQGVLRTRVGYSGGTSMEPRYRSMGDHTEVIEIDFDPNTVQYTDLLELFWDNHEYGLTSRIKRQYMSLILYHSDEQKTAAEQSMKKKSLHLNQNLITEIAQAGAFYSAEDYHQKYRFQHHPWLMEALEMTPVLLQRSHIAARMNGYLVGLGKKEDLDKDLIQLGLTDKMIEYVQNEWTENMGGSLYC